MIVTPDSEFGKEHFVFLDGKKYTNCIFADDEAGYIEVVTALTILGKSTAILYGKVTFHHIFECDNDPYEV